MVAAQALYRSLGFVPIERDPESEMLDTCFFGLDLGTCWRGCSFTNAPLTSTG